MSMHDLVYLDRPAGDVVLVATATVLAPALATPEGEAEVLLELEENLGAQARQRGRELREARVVERHYLKRHTWTDQETRESREWLERVVAEEADLVRVVAAARSYQDGHPSE